MNDQWRSHREFSSLNEKILSILQKDAKDDPKRYLSHAGAKFEEIAFEVANQAARNTPFEGRIERISGQKFPDLVALVKDLGGYGIEVKTTTKNHWTTTGSSIFEGTRVDGVERISLLFAKLCNPIEFKCRPYEDCLESVAVTHSPRYLINMEAEETIFDKIQIPYDELRNQSNPFAPIKQYFRNKVVKTNQDIWWIDPTEEVASSLVIRHFADLPKEEKQLIQAQGMVLFPQIFGKDKHNKYKGFLAWLAASHGVVNGSLRDLYSAGGQVNLNIQGTIYPKTPRVYHHLQVYAPQSLEFLRSLEKEELEFYWQKKVGRSRIQTWIRLIEEHSQSAGVNLPIEGIIRQ